jgi:quercetin dioxygenase-like cupin family protein
MKKQTRPKWRPIRELGSIDSLRNAAGDVSRPDKISAYSIQRWAGIGTPNPALLRHQLRSEGYSVFQWSDAPGSVYGSHKHDCDQSHWVISGSLELNVEGCGVFVLNAGDRDLMFKGTYHSARVLGNEPAIYLIGERRS